jgi:hypothetical protein
MTWWMSISSGALLAACSSTTTSTGAPADGGGGSDAAAVDAGDDVAAEGPASCTATSACAQTPTATQQCVTTVSTTLLDPTGAAAGGIPVFVCGTNLCSAPKKTAADGTVQLTLCLPLATPALKVFDDPAWGPFAAALQGAGPSFAVGSVTVTPLPSTGATMAAGTASATSGGVTLSLAGTTVKFDVEHQSADSQMFRAATVNPATLPPPLGGQVTAAWALAPLNTKLTPAAQLQLPNPSGWAAGAAVDVYLNGTDTTTKTPFAPWGAWGLIGTGAVSTDGQSIVLTTAQGGLPEIAMVGVKLH